MTHPLAPLLVPELRWDPGHGFTYLDEMIGDALELGVGGFLITGGARDDVVLLTRELHRRSRDPVLIAADVECGAGGAFSGLTGLPPLAPLAVLRDRDVFIRAAKLTARELRALGVNWALAPVSDLARASANPWLGARTLGADAQRAAEWTVEWIDACQGEGVLACAKHFPGIGRAEEDPNLGTASVDAAAGTLWGDDLLPFRAAVDTGVASVMAAGVSFPGLDASGRAAARSRPVLTDFLRDELGYQGLIVSDVLGTPGLLQGDDEGIAAIEAVGAGCDLLLAPADLHGVIESLERANDGGMLSYDALEESRNRRAFWADWGSPAPGREPTLDDVLWARQVADVVVHPVRGVMPNIGPVVDVLQVDDDADVRWPRPSRRHFTETLQALGLDARLVDGPTAEGRGSFVIAIFGGPGAGKGRAGYGEVTRRRVARALADARQAKRSAVVVLFGPPALAAEVPEAVNVVCCWSDERAMQEAGARRLV